MNETKHNTNQQLQPGSPNFVTRRHFIQTAAALSSLAGATASAAAADDTAKDKSRTALNQPLGEDYVVVTQVPDKTYFIHDPAMAMLPNGCLVVAAPVWPRSPEFIALSNALEGRSAAEVPVQKERKFSIVVSRSKDGGKTWTRVYEKPPGWGEVALYVHEGRLYMFRIMSSSIFVSASDDEGTSWTEPVEVIKSDWKPKLFGIQTGMVVLDGWLYWAVGGGMTDMGVVACELKKGLLNPEAWVESKRVAVPIPKEVMSGAYSDGWDAGCLEGNVVHVGGKLLVIARMVINRYGTSNMAAVFELTREGRTLTLIFRQLYPLPGGQFKFHILWDERSRLFWMASNFPTNSWGLYHDPAVKLPVTRLSGSLREDPPVCDSLPCVGYPQLSRSLREDRRLLMLSYSLDALNWLPACCIAKAEKMTQSFMYPSMVIDGDDIALISRTARDSNDFHDADLVTFHRVRNFRSLAMDIHPKL